MTRIIRYTRRGTSIPRGDSPSGVFFLVLMIALIIFMYVIFKPLPQAADCPTGGAISVPAAGYSEDPPIARSTP